MPLKQAFKNRPMIRNRPTPEAEMAVSHSPSPAARTFRQDRFCGTTFARYVTQANLNRPQVSCVETVATGPVGIIQVDGR